MKKYLSFWIYSLSAFSFAEPIKHTEQFVSLNLCSDRLLAEFAHPEQIAAQSPYSKKPLMMLDKVNTDKPVVEPQLLDLLPYRHTTILLNENFYPQLVAQLKAYGFKTIALNDSPQTADELFELMLQLGEITQNQAHAKQWVEKLRLQNFALNQPLTDTLILSETGIAYMHLPQYQTLLKLLGLTPLQSDLNEQNFSLEKMLLARPNVLIQIADQKSYNNRSELLNHPALQHFFKNSPFLTLPMKYTYCFDHGVWQGAELIKKTNLP